MAQAKKRIENDDCEKEIQNVLDQYVDEAKKKLDTYVDEQIDLKIMKKMKEEEKRYVRIQRGKIWRRDIVIILLLIGFGYFGFCLYKIDYFKIKDDIVLREDNNSKQEQDFYQENNKEELLKEYSYLVDNLQIEDEDILSLYKNDINNVLKLKIAYKNMINSNDYSTGDMITFSSEEMEKAAKKIWGSNYVIRHENFKYNMIQFLYYNGMYLGIKEDFKKMDYIYQINDVKLNKDKLIFEVLMGKIGDQEELIGKSEKIVLKKYNKEKLENYKEDLYSLTLNFRKENEEFVLEEE